MQQLSEALKKTAVAKNSAGSDEHVEDFINALRASGLEVVPSGELQRLRNKIDYRDRKISELETGVSSPATTRSHADTSTSDNDEQA